MQTIKPHNDLQLDYKECKNDPFLFGDFVVNFSVFSLIWSISSSVANTTNLLSPCCSQIIFHIFQIFFFLSLLGLYSFGSIVFWIQLSGENWVVAERCSKETTFGKSEGEILFYVHQGHSLALQRLYCFSETHHLTVWYCQKKNLCFHVKQSKRAQFVSWQIESM